MFKIFKINQKEKKRQLDNYLIEAITIDESKLVKKAVKKGADVNVSKGLPIRYSALYGNLEVVKFLVENGATGKEAISTAIKWADMYEHKEVSDYLKSSIINN